MWRIIELIQAFMGIHVTCKNEEDHSKMKVLEWSQKISHCRLNFHVLWDHGFNCGTLKLLEGH